MSYPRTFLKLFKVTDSTISLLKVGETFKVRALASSIGTTTGCEKFSYNDFSLFFWIKLASEGVAYFYSTLACSY